MLLLTRAAQVVGKRQRVTKPRARRYQYPPWCSRSGRRRVIPAGDPGLLLATRMRSQCGKRCGPTGQ